MKEVRFLIPALLATILAAATGEASEPSARDAAVADHLSALENAAFEELGNLVLDFENNRFASAFKAETTPSARREILQRIRNAASDVDDIMVEETEGAIVLTLAGEETHDVVFAVEESPPFGIRSLEVSKAAATAPALTLTIDTLAEELHALEEEGLSGVISLKIDGKIVHQAAYGFADESTDRENTVETIFGIGSRPIDFTVAAILLLEQRDLLRLDDKIVEYYDNVPPDKRSITVQHLLTGQSGLPDFPARPEDWDADLAWISKEEFERRTMEVPLIFAPGQGRKHSHWAFGLLASIVERVSGKSYYAFLREDFLDPAGMQRTGEYGETRDLAVSDFAIGAGPSFVGLPNIPPNWGPTSWLVKGSGGMYSTVGDLIRFYELIRSGTVLEPKYIKHFSGPTVNVDGSGRGFELFSSYDEDGSDEVFLAVNMRGPGGLFDDIGRALEMIIEEN